MPKQTSIQSRLLTSLLVGLPLLWLITTASISYRLWHEINEIHDTQLVQLSRYLSSISTPTANLSLSPPPDVQRDNDNEPMGNKDNEEEKEQDDDHEAPVIYQVGRHRFAEDVGNAQDHYLGFAIWDSQGKLLMADENGEDFVFLPQQHGFLENPSQGFSRFNPFADSDNAGWRLFYVHEATSGRIIAVGQNLDSRQALLTQALGLQILPMLVGLAAFLLWVVWSVRQGFVPLRQVTAQLVERTPQDDTPLSAPVPSEIQPLVKALNELFVKVADTLAREKRFTADASHELRSPLTALKLQADVLEQQILQSHLPEGDENRLFHHAEQISHNVERASHLVEQLLILAKLSPEHGLSDEQKQPIDWLTLSDTVLSEVNRTAREKHSQLKRELLNDTLLPMTGNTTLFQLLLRNLLDNAIRYTPQGSIIRLQLDKDRICVVDNGGGVKEADLARLTERFFRPAGQTERGSGLGLSIVKHIADLHGLQVTLANISDNGVITGFKVTLQR